MIESSGFDPGIGFYHLPDRDRPSLACDWVEEFRHSIVDRMVLKMINCRAIEPSHFQEQEHAGIRLTPDGLKKFIETYDKTMNGHEPERYPPQGAARTLLLQQLGALYDSILRRETYVSHFETVPQETAVTV